MKLLVTGGCGFIGSNFVRYMIENVDCEIVNLDLLTYAGNRENLSDIEGGPNYEFVKGDVLDQELIRYWSQWADSIVHFAAQTHVDRSILDPASFINTNILGTSTLLEAVRLTSPMKRLIYISTDEVYGDIATGEAQESSPIEPNSPYSASKASGDLMVRAYNRTFGLGVITTRTSNNFGPFQYPEKFIPLIITHRLEEKRIPVYGDGLQERDWIHVEDNCRAIELILRKGVPGECYNIANGNSMPNLAIIRELLELMGGFDSSYLEYVKDRPGHDRRYAIECQKIRTLGWEPKFDFGKALRRTVEWYQTHGNWWRQIKERKKEYVDYYELQYSGR